MLKPWFLVFAVLLSACGYKWNPTDVDGDGFTPEDGDCWDAEQGPDDSVGGAQIYPGAAETWYDGVDQDCGGDNDFDQDGDGVDQATADHPGEDCDDTDATVYPGAEDAFYDGIDSDCADDGDPVNDYDQDGDGYDAAGYGDGDDCDDLDSAVNPSAVETWYDGVDQNCDARNDYDQDGDGFVVSEECDDEDATRYPDDSIEEVWYNGLDENCDGNDGDQDGDGYVPDDYAEAYDWEAFNAHLGTGDCWDDPADLVDHVPVDGSSLSADQVNPDAVETWYNGVDEDCLGGSDFDQDGDGHDSAYHEDGDGLVGDDCIDGSPEDDENPAGLDPAEVNPDAVDSWYDGTDQDCMGNDDYDQDYDGYGADSYGDGDDCDDTLSAVHPDADEVCSTSYDDDCDTDTNDPGATGCEDFYVDSDGDGEGDLSRTACLCEADATYETTDAEDCDDSDADINTSASEITGDEVDQNCDGTETCYADNDRDGYRTDTTKASTDVDCDDAREASASMADGDCSDTDDDINPGATEVTGDGVDSDCDDEEICYADADSDGYRTTTTVTSTDADCTDTGEALSTVTSGDCDDTDSGVSPGDAEITGDSIDENCDGKETCYTDADDDGYRKSSGTTSSTDTDCTDSGEGSSTDESGDCKDTDATINPGATEITGDGVDQNCDSKETCYTDADEDGYRTDSTVTSTTDTDCLDAGEALSTATGGDCADDDELTYPGASETCEDDVVNDCDGTEEAALAECDWDPDYTMSAVNARRYGESANAYAGYTVGFMTDMDGDGDDEVVIGAAGVSGSKGAVYVLNGPLTAGNAKLSSRKAKVTGEAGGDQIGFAIADAGDVDNDGLGDLLMGAPYNNGPGGDSGSAYLYLGDALSGDINAPTGGTEWTGAAADIAGSGVAGVGDLDNDGYDDVLVGVPKSDFTGTNLGGVYLIEGPASTGGLLSAVATSIVQGASNSDLLGSAVSRGGDVDGDGDEDILFGGGSIRTPAALTDDNAGVAYLILGPTVTSGTANTIANLILVGTTGSDAAGTSIAGGADVDGDGYDDMLVGAPGADTGATDGGAAYLVYGEATPSGSLTLSGADATFTGVAASDAAGTSVALADVTGDGLAEVLVGAPGADPDGGAARGAAYLFFGGDLSSTVSLSTGDVIFGGESDGDALGTSVAAGGDANEDGYLDLILGAPYRDQSATDDGQTYYVPGTGY